MASTSLIHEGVRYEPVNLPGKGQQESISIEYLRANGIKYIRIQWVDLVNNIRYRVLPLSYFDKLLKTSRPGTSLTKAALGIVFITLAEGVRRVLDVILDGRISLMSFFTVLLESTFTHLINHH